MAVTEISERAQRLLKALVERYIREGQPVGSRTLARDSRMDLSPATIRNVMADLEELGLITAPHTSAGRIPTVHGYRVFVDSLLTIKPLEEREIMSLKAQIGVAADPKRALHCASALLSEITTMAGVVMIPRRGHVALRQVEFIPLSGNRVLVVLIINDREVQNRVIETSRHYSASELRQAANFLSEEFAGLDLGQIREKLMKELEDVRVSVDQAMRQALEMAQAAFSGEDEADDGDYLLAGQTNLMTYDDMGDKEQLRQLFEAFNHKRDVLQLLDQCINAQGIQIFIGSESGREVFDACSVVTSPYQVEGEVVGVLGVIGPTRMAYGRVIPLVDVTARLLSAALNQGG